MPTSVKKRIVNNRRRGKQYERQAALLVGGQRNLDKGRPHTDVETDMHVYEIKSTTSTVPSWIDSALRQCELAALESNKSVGGLIKVFTGGMGKKARYIKIQELSTESLNPKIGSEPRIQHVEG